MSVLTLLALFFWIGTALGNPCKQDWVLYGDSCYAFGETPVPWADAQDFCRAAGGKLAEIETSAENQFLKTQASNRNGGSFWIGGTDVFHEGVWSWITSGALISFTDWGPGQPDDISGQDCLHFWPSHSNQWADGVCLNNFFFICEAEAEEIIVG